MTGNAGEDNGAMDVEGGEEADTQAPAEPEIEAFKEAREEQKKQLDEVKAKAVSGIFSQ